MIKGPDNDGGNTANSPHKPTINQNLFTGTQVIKKMKSNRISKTQAQSPGFRVEVSRNNDSRKMDSINTPTTLQNEANMAMYTKRE